MDYKEIISVQKNKFKEGIKRTDDNKSQWESLTVRITNIFQELIKESKDQTLFENLYLYNSFECKEYPSNMHIVQLSWGQHPTGLVKTEFDKASNEKSKKLTVEAGGALVFSQNIMGGVAVLIYPMKSEEFKRDEENIISDLYLSPTDITNEKIQRAINDFFSYSQYSSIYGSPSYMDKVRVQWLILRDIRNKKENSLFLMKHSYELVKTLIPLLVGIFIGVFTIK